MTARVFIIQRYSGQRKLLEMRLEVDISTF